MRASIHIYCVCVYKYALFIILLCVMHYKGRLTFICVNVSVYETCIVKSFTCVYALVCIHVFVSDAWSVSARTRIHAIFASYICHDMLIIYVYSNLCRFIVIYLALMHALVFAIVYYNLHYFHYGCDPGVSALDPGRGGVKWVIGAGGRGQNYEGQ